MSAATEYTRACCVPFPRPRPRGLARAWCGVAWCGGTSRGVVARRGWRGAVRQAITRVIVQPTARPRRESGSSEAVWRGGQIKAVTHVRNQQQARSPARGREENVHVWQNSSTVTPAEQERHSADMDMQHMRPSCSKERANMVVDNYEWVSRLATSFSHAPKSNAAKRTGGKRPATRTPPLWVARASGKMWPAARAAQCSAAS